MTVDNRNYKWTGKVAAVLCGLLLYVGSYCGLRHHYTGSLVNDEGYVTVEEINTDSTTKQINWVDFGPTVPHLPIKLNRALDAIFYPIREADMALTKNKMNFALKFPMTPPSPDFFEIR